MCKQRWTNIRDQYKKNLKSLKTVTGQAAKKIKLYKFSEQLQFLTGIDEDRNVISNFVECSETMPSPPSDDHLSMSNDSITINQQSNSQAQDDIVASSSPMSPAASSATNEKGEPPSDLPIKNLRQYKSRRQNRDCKKRCLPLVQNPLQLL